MRTHDEFWQTAFRRATESLKRDGVDLDDWTLETRAANHPAADGMVNGEGGFIDATVGHADPGPRVLTLFVHEFVWDQAKIAEHMGGMAACPGNSPEAILAVDFNAHHERLAASAKSAPALSLLPTLHGVEFRPAIV